MKRRQFSILLILLSTGFSSFAQNSDDRQLWLITARISHQSTYQRDTASSFMAGTKKWAKEYHQTAKVTSSGTISAVVENQAENPAKDFLYHSDSGDPVSITVTGNGSSSESSNSQETIDGILVTAGTRTDNASGSARPGASLYFEYSADSKSFGASMGIKAVGSYNGRMYSGGKGYGEWKDYGEEIKDYSISCGGGGDAVTDKSCKMTKTGKGYQGSWKESESKTHHTPNGPEYTTSETTIEITVMPYKESDKPVLTLIGCSELGAGENSMVVATAKPEGGTFRFWAEPSSVLTVETDGSSANITGASPGKGTLFVEYTTPEGKTAQTQAEASCVKIESYNGGQAIPQIALYDINGKKQSGIKTVPVQAQPSDAAELVKFEPADPGILSAVGSGSEVTIQGLHEGKTTLQAKTRCGEETGPEVEVEVVKCDEETKATLERMKEAAMENLVEATEKLKEEANSEKFEEARDELVKSTEELLVKSGLTILGSGKVHGAAETAIEVAEAAESAIDLLGSADSKQFAESAMLTTLKALGSSVTKAAAGAVGVHEAAKKFGDNVGEILKHEDVMEGLDKNYEKAMRDLDRITKRQQFCKGDTEKPKSKEQPKSDQTPKPKEPTPPIDPTPKPDPTKGDQPKPAEPTPTEPTSDDEVIGDPEPPIVPPKQVGLPYEPAACGCDQSKELTVKSADFATLGKGIKNLGDCVENFRSTSLTDYQNSLQEISVLTDSLLTALETNAAEFQVKAKSSNPRLGELVSQVKTYDKAGNDFLKKMNKCPQSVTSGMEIFKSVEKITIDSIKTNY